MTDRARLAWPDATCAAVLHKNVDVAAKLVAPGASLLLPGGQVSRGVREYFPTFELFDGMAD